MTTKIISTRSGAAPAPVTDHPIMVEFQQTADETVANTITETTIVGSGVGSFSIPANTMKVGDRFILRAEGLISDTGNPSFNIRIKLGATTILDSGMQNLGSVSNSHWVVDASFIVRAIGVSGSIMPVGSFITALGDHFELITLSPITIDTTVVQAADFTAQWATASVSNTITSQLLSASMLSVSVP